MSNPELTLDRVMSFRPCYDVEKVSRTVVLDQALTVPTGGES